MMRGEIAIAGRAGRERLWDVAERVYPVDIEIPSVEEAERIRNERRLRALGIARAKGTKMPIEPIDVGDAGEPAVVDGVARRMARRSRGVGSGLRGPDGAAVAVRPAGLRPGARAGAVRLRVRARDVQAEGQAPLGLLRATRPARGPARRQGRCDRRPQARRCWRCTPSTRTSASRGRSRRPCTPSSRRCPRGSASSSRYGSRPPR